jgi:hypothetical protein
MKVYFVDLFVALQLAFAAVAFGIQLTMLLRAHGAAKGCS